MEKLKRENIRNFIKKSFGRGLVALAMAGTIGAGISECANTQENKNYLPNSNYEMHKEDNITRGTKYYRNGWVYVGEMKNGYPEGKGKMYINGEVFGSGEWENGLLKNGEGIIIRYGKKIPVIYKTIIRNNEEIIIMYKKENTNAKNKKLSNH